MKTLRELMSDEVTCEIVCPFKKTVMRRLTAFSSTGEPGDGQSGGDMVRIDANGEIVDVPIDTPIIYEPWVFDRGNMLIALPDDLASRYPDSGGRIKLCTEADLVRYPGGAESWVTPTEHCLDCGAEIIGAHGHCPGVPGGFSEEQP